MGLDLDANARAQLWRTVTDAVTARLAGTTDLSPSSTVDAAAVAALVNHFDFDCPGDPVQTLELILHGLRAQQAHGEHPRSFGLFDAAPTTMAIAGDVLAAT